MAGALILIFEAAVMALLAYDVLPKVRQIWEDYECRPPWMLQWWFCPLLAIAVLALGLGGVLGARGKVEQRRRIVLAACIGMFGIGVVLYGALWLFQRECAQSYSAYVPG